MHASSAGSQPCDNFVVATASTVTERGGIQIFVKTFARASVWNENRERLGWPHSRFPHNRKCFLKFVFFCFFDLPVRRSIPARNFDPLREPVETFRPENPSDCAPSLSVCNYSVGRHLLYSVFARPVRLKCRWLPFLLKEASGLIVATFRLKRETFWLKSSGP